MARRELPEVNAGSMADIAFTLLIFFLVTTTLATDKGEKVLLPKYNENQDQTPTEVSDWNVFAVDVLQDGSLSVEGLPFQYKNLKEETVKFLLNNGKNPEYSESYDAAVVNIRVHPDGPYEAYVEAYSNVKAAFNLIRNDYALQKYGKKYDDFTDAEKVAADEVRDKFGLKIAEKVMDEDDFN